MRKVLALILASVMAISLAGCGSATPATTTAAPATTTAAAATTEAAAPAKLMAEPLKLKVSYVEDPSTGIGTVMPKAFEKITELTNGELQFEIFPSGLLGTQADVAEQIASGAPIIATVGMNSLIESLSPLATPYVLQNIDETLAFSKTDYYKKSVEELRAIGYMPVCMGSLGIRHTISTKEIKSAADFDGLIIRMAATAPSQGFAAVMGGTPITSAWGDIYSMISTGACEATEAPLDLLYSTALYEVCDYLCMTAHLTTPFQFVMSTQYWDKIPAEYQKVMTDVLDDACVEMADIYKAADAEFVQKFKDKGVKVCEDPDIESFASTLPALFKYLEWDENVYNEIRNSIDSVVANGTTTENATKAATPEKLMAEPLKLKVSYVEDPSTGIGTVMPKAFEKITELTNGELQFEIFPSGLLGTQADVAEQIASGAPIIATVGMNSLIESLSPLATPYVLQNIDETLAFSKTDYYKKSVEELKAIGYVPVCMGSLGIRHTISTKEIKSAADFDGLIIRMAATAPSQGFAAVMGGTPITSAWGDIYSMISTGACEATEAPLDLLYSTALYEVCDYLCMTAHLTTPFQFVMSTQYWDKIPAEYQKVMTDVLDDACVEMADIYKAADAEFVQKFKDKGVKVCEDPDIESFANTLPELFKYLKWDENVYKEIRNSIDAVM